MRLLASVLAPPLLRDVVHGDNSVRGEEAGPSRTTLCKPWCVAAEGLFDRAGGA
jgi:hypothetical protein